MGIRYKVSDKQLLKLRNKVFVDFGIPALKRNGFERSPFSTDWFGRDNCGDYFYCFCRLNKAGCIEFINVYITRGDSWIKVKLNIFFPQPIITSLLDLEGRDGLHYGLPPNSQTEMRLRIDDRKCIPLFYLFGKKHKIGAFYSEAGMNRRIKALSRLIELDLDNVDYFIGRWYDIYSVPKTTTWEGLPI